MVNSFPVQLPAVSKIAPAIASSTLFDAKEGPGLLICGVCCACCPVASFGRAAKGGESLLEVQARASEALEACLDRGHDTNLIVSHGR